jgi:predicted Rossmann fold nucleotide-binding protein DprA/Smf involved in DNA uptake
MADDEQLRLLREIARWTREAALPSARERVERLLDSDPKKRVYDAMAEGTRSVAVLEKETGANHNDIRKWLKVWEAEGIAEVAASPPKATFTLAELGIEPAPERVRRTKKTTKS